MIHIRAFHVTGFKQQMDAELLQANTASEISAKALTQRMRENLIAIGRNRDEKAFHDFYAHFSGRIKSFLMGKGTQESVAEELMQEIMLIVWRRAESYNPEKRHPAPGCSRLREIGALIICVEIRASKWN